MALELPGIGPDGEARLGRRALAQPDARVEREHAAGVGDQGVDVELDDVRVARSSVREAGARSRGEHRQPSSEHGSFTAPSSAGASLLPSRR